MFRTSVLQVLPSFFPVVILGGRIFGLDLEPSTSVFAGSVGPFGSLIALLAAKRVQQSSPADKHVLAIGPVLQRVLDMYQLHYDSGASSPPPGASKAPFYNELNEKLTTLLHRGAEL